MKTVKTAVSVSAAIYNRVEALRRKAKKSRSAIYAEALEKLIKAEEARVADEEYALAYRRFPETKQERAEAAAWLALSMESWSKEKW